MKQKHIKRMIRDVENVLETLRYLDDTENFEPESEDEKQQGSIKDFCEYECPFDECYAEDKKPENCWCIQRKFPL